MEYVYQNSTQIVTKYATNINKTLSLYHNLKVIGGYFLGCHKHHIHSKNAS